MKAATKVTPETERRRYLKRHSALKEERASWMSHWRDISDYLYPRRSRFLGNGNEKNDGSKRNDKIINNTATRAAGTLEAGISGSMTPQAAPWFRLTTPDPTLSENDEVREWLHIAAERMLVAIAKSNLYDCFPLVYRDLVGPGTAALYIDEDVEEVFRGYVFPIGSYALQNSAKLKVDTVYREFSMTVGQLVEKFKIENVSSTVREHYENDKLDLWIDVVHVIEPNLNLERGRADYRGMPWRSCWMESSQKYEAGFLQQGGYREFPISAPRWTTTGEDIYGSSPAMDALGDMKALQVLEKEKAKALAKVVTPPMTGPPSIIEASLIPGSYTPNDGHQGGQKYEPAMTPQVNAVSVAEASIREHEARIDETFFKPLWLQLAMAEQQMTAEEVRQRREERMLQMGTVVERVRNELLDTAITRCFNIMVRRGMFPPPPKALLGMDLRVEYMSTLVQAQKMVRSGAVERLATFVGNLASIDKRVLDKINLDEMVDDYADMLGTNPQLINSDDEVARIREERAQREQVQQQSETALAATGAAKNLGSIDMGNDNALKQLLAAYGGSAPPGPEGIQ